FDQFDYGASNSMNFMDFAREAAEAMSLAASSVEEQQTTYGVVDSTSESGHTGARASKERCKECLCMKSMEACAESGMVFLLPIFFKYTDPQAALRVLGALDNGCARVRFDGGGFENVFEWTEIFGAQVIIDWPDMKSLLEKLRSIGLHKGSPKGKWDQKFLVHTDGLTQAAKSVKEFRSYGKFCIRYVRHDNLL
ncbi:pentatricopeptide repeat (PPR) superfamily protein, partial [Striga asiatica]